MTLAIAILFVVLLMLQERLVAPLIFFLIIQHHIDLDQVVKVEHFEIALPPDALDYRAPEVGI